MRITGLATGLDMDQIVKDSMKPYRVKIDQTQQNRDIIEMKQQLYRDVIKDSRDLYNKYFDISKDDSLLLSKNWSATKFESSNNAAVSVSSGATAKAGNYKVNVTQLATAPKAIVSIAEFKDMETFAVSYKGEDVTVDIKGLTNEKDIAKKINTELKSIGIKAEYSTFANGIVIQSNETGEDINGFTIKMEGDKNNPAIIPIDKQSDKGTDLLATIEGSNGTIEYDDKNKQKTNKVTIDGIEFSFNDITTVGGVKNEVRITGKTDAKSTADKIVTFVNDYNTMVEKLNTMTSEKRNKSYMPLTEEQKKEMSESEIKLWNEKTKQGQLNRDSDVTRIVNKIKSAMNTSVGGISLESIGIKPVKDYGTKNGTFTVDEEKLKEALENNSEEIMNMFIGVAPEGTPENEKPSKTGIFQKLKTTLYEETVMVTSPLIVKAGVEGSATVSNNELSKVIEKYNKKMVELEKDFARREQALYSKYARLEVAMNKYNSQQSMMAQQMGGQ